MEWQLAQEYLSSGSDGASIVLVVYIMLMKKDLKALTDKVNLTENANQRDHAGIHARIDRTERKL